MDTFPLQTCRYLPEVDVEVLDVALELLVAILEVKEHLQRY